MAFAARTSGGKGNIGLFFEHDPKICAAGMPTAQPKESVKAQMSNYSYQDEVNALINDAIIPSAPVFKLPPLRHPNKCDMRNAGIFNEGSALINPPVKTKFETLVEDFKNTSYNSYWNRDIGKTRDPVRTLPEGFKIYETVLGKKKASNDNLYEVIMPTHSIPDNTSITKKPGYQTNRNYCFFKPNVTFGIKTNVDRSGKAMKCCLRDDNIYLGTALKRPITERQAKIQFATVTRLGIAQTPNDNIKQVPEGFTFGKLKPPGNLPECLRTCEINPYKDEITKCLGHLNTLRKCLAKRFDGHFFHTFYLRLKFLDELKRGWLLKQIVYNECSAKHIRFNPTFIEPLLTMWHAFDGSQIEYKTFIYVINHMEPSPEIPKIQDMASECVDYRTTYNEMVKENCNLDYNGNMAGIPSGRYLDKIYPVTPSGYCKADRTYLPQESDMRACLNPSIFTLLGVSHRDMYAKRDSKIVRQVFENTGEIFEDDQFEKIWEIAKRSHSKGWVCFETFRRSLVEYKKHRETGK